MKRIWLAWLPILILVEGFAQNQPAQDPRVNYQVVIQRTTSPIQLDGRLEEPIWQDADVATDFWQKFPQDGVPAELKTEVRFTYDDRFLYISAVCFDPDGYVVQTLKRDSRFFEGDAFGIVLDP